MKRKVLRMKRKRKVDVAWVGSLRECAGPDAEVFLDTYTGRAVVLSQRVIAAALSGEREARERLDPSEKGDLGLAEAILRDGTDRFAPVPAIPPATRYGWMTEFAAVVADPDVFARLETALDIAPVFERFDRALAPFGVERHEWYYFRRRKLADDTSAWLATLDIESVAGAVPVAD